MVGSIGLPFLIHASKELGVPILKLRKVIQKFEVNLELGKVDSIKFWYNICSELNVQYPSKEKNLTNYG